MRCRSIMPCLGSSWLSLLSFPQSRVFQLWPHVAARSESLPAMIGGGGCLALASEGNTPAQAKTTNWRTGKREGRLAAALPGGSRHRSIASSGSGAHPSCILSGIFSGHVDNRVVIRSLVLLAFPFLVFLRARRYGIRYVGVSTVRLPPSPVEVCAKRKGYTGGDQ